MIRAQENRERYRYGRHGTFAVRHGWLQKGLHHIQKTGEFRSDLETADRLGLGSRMVKSLSFWLEASGLARPIGRRRSQWVLTEFGKNASRYDRHFEYPISWWFIHASLATRKASVWGWFFNEFQERRFTKDTCLSAFLEHLERRSSNRPSQAVAERDVTCLLNAYATHSAHSPGTPPDPEDATICPLRDLALVMRHTDINRFEKCRPIDEVPVEAFLSCASNLADRLGSDGVAFKDLMREPNSPARIFGMGSYKVEEMAEVGASLYKDRGVALSLLATERHLIVPHMKESGWLQAHFERISRAAA